MTGSAVTLEGGANLRRTSGRAARRLPAAAEAADRATAQLVARRSRRKAPRVSGALGSSVTSDGDTVVSRLIYAGVIHDGWPGHNIEPQPFIREVAEDSEAAALLIHEEAVQGVLDTIKGI